MAKDYDFRPDSEVSPELDKLLLSQRQRFSLLRWALYGALCLAGLLLQDAVLCRVDVGGGCTDLVPCLIFMITALQGAEQGSVFALIGAVLYYCTGSAPGMYVIPVITIVAVLMAIVRQAYLPRGFFSIFLSAAVTMTVYELLVFAMGLLLKQTFPQRWICALWTAALTLVAVPVIYPVLRGVAKIGGETWKE